MDNGESKKLEEVSGILYPKEGGRQEYFHKGFKISLENNPSIPKIVFVFPEGISDPEINLFRGFFEQILSDPHLIGKWMSGFPGGFSEGGSSKGNQGERDDIVKTI